jgi:uncharacterized protein (DUF2249 family)
MAATRLDIRGVTTRRPGPAIHDGFESLEAGETLELANDHEPTPLCYEFQAEPSVRRRRPRRRWGADEFGVHVPRE